MNAYNPYRNLPDFHYWRRSVADVPSRELDPVIDVPFKIGRTAKVATAGSCFAQHIARAIRKNGYNYFVAEDAHPLVPVEFRHKYSYGVFSARYGNIYTVRQLLQLLRRAYGEFVPRDEFWRAPNGSYLDPFRPNIQPDGFASPTDLRLDKNFHLSRVRYLFENLDYFVFTLGLTEAWENVADHATFPLCPFVVSEDLSKEGYRFVNFSVDDVRAELFEFITRLRQINPRFRLVLTVSPVPLVATYEDKHVLCATTYSKSVLRIAAEEAEKRFPYVIYFPSFEIISGHYAKGSYFADDLRSVTSQGVDHVMRVFFKHFAAEASSEVGAVSTEDLRNEESRDYEKLSGNINQVLCDEEMLD